jgi:hypothetical protein
MVGGGDKVDVRWTGHIGWEWAVNADVSLVDVRLDVAVDASQGVGVNVVVDELVG